MSGAISASVSKNVFLFTQSGAQGNKKRCVVKTMSRVNTDVIYVGGYIVGFLKPISVHIVVSNLSPVNNAVKVSHEKRP